MYNGIGLTTPRGSGTNGYVVRNLSHLRHHETPAERAAAFERNGPPKHREPDEGILEHERKRKVEVKCLELQVQLEDDGISEEEIESQVEALRKKLLEDMATMRITDPKLLKSSDTHGLAAAKKAELSRMAAAFGTRQEYVEGDAFDQEKQAELRERRKVERLEREARQAEERKRIEEQKAKWEADRYVAFGDMLVLLSDCRH
ncbi:cwf21-domain-containing protein [Sistotremastrum niveocremeum HHB9708]|uniref:Cwf21-domain-containing protein n=2 Tax=Sistotremastraceae TaxID=3402574 RepID=A0A164Z505_9AGAM|nr:cwf21-domain-containing protein [Sistotremastrum niveocremeum HHB9708]KZT37656.1 cwf21-domain-containing protein [Sistotremastrum suecicum HHB10207 ss-3]